MNVLEIVDLDDHRLAGTDVGYRGREQIGTLLLDQAGLFAGLLCCLVLLARRFFLADLALDETFTDIEPHVVHRGRLGQWKDIDALHPFIARVPEFLHHRHPRDEAVDVDVDVGIEQRGRRIPLTHAHEQGAGLHVGGCKTVRGRWLRQRQCQNQQRAGENGNRVLLEHGRPPLLPSFIAARQNAGPWTATWQCTGGMWQIVVGKRPVAVSENAWKTLGQTHCNRRRRNRYPR